MKYFIIIVLTVLISFGVFFLAFQKETGEPKEVTVRATIEKNKDEEWLLKIVLKNETSNKIVISELGGEWVDFRLDMWAVLGQGIQLYPKSDAEWRRHHAFPIMKLRFIDPGMSKEVILALDEMMPADPDNDELARSIIDDYKEYKDQEAYLNIDYNIVFDENTKKYIKKMIPIENN